MTSFMESLSSLMFACGEQGQDEIGQDRDDGHDAQKQDQPFAPTGVAQFEEQDARRCDFLNDVVGARIDHGSASSDRSGAKWRSTLSAIASANVGGCQRGRLSLSMITARIPS